MDMVKTQAPGRGRRPWTPPVLKPVGTIAEVVGVATTGKISVTTGDPGEPRKVTVTG